MVVKINPRSGSPARLALGWAVRDDVPVSQVGAGENVGENVGVTLHHDHVVRRCSRLPAWAVSTGMAMAQRVSAARNGEGGRKVRLMVVVTAAVTGAPLQAARMVC